MSSLAAALADAKPGRRTNCWWVEYTPRMNDIDRQALDNALADWTIFGTTIAAILTGEGFPVKGQDIQRHRRKECTCGDR